LTPWRNYFGPASSILGESWKITLVLAKKTDPPYVSDELLAGLRERPDFTLLEFDCDHMVPQARPADTAAVIRKQLDRD